jgi:exportin-7
MNTLAQRKSLTQHRKTAVSFRDLALRGIFESAIFTLKELARSMSSWNTFSHIDPTLIAQKPRLCSEALSVVLASLKFDFVGIFPDESTEDVGTIQVRLQLFT